MTTLNRLTAFDAATQLREGEVSASALTQACLDRIDTRDSKVRAWVQVNADQALATAQRQDALAKDGQWLGPLHGIAVGIKDIYNVAGFPTAFGSDAWPPITPEHDAVSVKRLRNAGAIILGKTVTTSFAMGDAGPTCNPWNLAHTPGGSSSGSAAAVADAMCFAALGTQTVGSVIRPASFNGLIGFKPSHGRINVDGIQALSWRLDHVGPLTRSVDDTHLLWQVLRNDAPADAASDIPVALTSRRPTRLWRFRDIFESMASDAMNAAMDAHCLELAALGVEIIEREMPVDMQTVLDMHQVVLASEAAGVHLDGFARYGEKYPPNIKGLIEKGQSISATEYLSARQYRRSAIAAFTAAMQDVDAAIMPAATDVAPAGLSTTGERALSAPSSFLGFPVMSYPVAIGEGGLPLGLQIQGLPNTEDQLLSHGKFCAATAAFTDVTPT
jgi:aspartyl-tRNA(Asn)/glutamyl-tRNA(Gln) amidotransferase subunit A